MTHNFLMKIKVNVRIAQSIVKLVVNQKKIVLLVLMDIIVMALITA